MYQDVKRLFCSVLVADAVVLAQLSSLFPILLGSGFVHVRYQRYRGVSPSIGTSIDFFCVQIGGVNIYTNPSALGITDSRTLRLLFTCFLSIMHPASVV